MTNPFSVFTKNLQKGFDKEIAPYPNLLADMKKRSDSLPLVMASGTHVYSLGFGFASGKIALPNGKIKLTAAIEYDFDNGVDGKPLIQFKLSFKVNDDNVVIGAPPKDLKDVIKKTLESLGVPSSQLSKSEPACTAELAILTSNLVDFTEKASKAFNHKSVN